MLRADIHTTGSNSAIAPRNYIVNILDKGQEFDGVDEAFIYGFDSGVNGVVGGVKPVDDIFLLRAGPAPAETDPGLGLCGAWTYVKR